MRNIHRLTYLLRDITDIHNYVLRGSLAVHIIYYMENDDIGSDYDVSAIHTLLHCGNVMVDHIAIARWYSSPSTIQTHKWTPVKRASKRECSTVDAALAVLYACMLYVLRGCTQWAIGLDGNVNIQVGSPK